MSDKQSRLYEGMFLVDANRASADEESIENYLKDTITRNGGEIVAFEKWDEMKLSYYIDGHSRGAYFLVHFNAPPTQLETLRRTFHLSDQVLRVLLLRDEDGTGSGKRILPDELDSPSRRRSRPAPGSSTAPAPPKEEKAEVESASDASGSDDASAEPEKEVDSDSAASEADNASAEPEGDAEPSPEPAEEPETEEEPAQDSDETVH